MRCVWRASEAEGGRGLIWRRCAPTQTDVLQADLEEVGQSREGVRVGGIGDRATGGTRSSERAQQVASRSKEQRYFYSRRRDRQSGMIWRTRCRLGAWRLLADHRAASRQQLRAMAVCGCVPTCPGCPTSSICRPLPPPFLYRWVEPLRLSLHVEHCLEKDSESSRGTIVQCR